MKVFSKCHIFGCLSNKWLLYHNLSQTPCTSPLGYWPEVIDRVTYLLRVGSERKEIKSIHSNYEYVNSWYVGAAREAVVQEPLDIMLYHFVPQTTGFSRKLKSKWYRKEQSTGIRHCKIHPLSTNNILRMEGSKSGSLWSTSKKRYLFAELNFIVP